MVAELHKLEHDHSRCQVEKRDLEQEICSRDVTVREMAAQLDEMTAKTAQLETAISCRDRDLALANEAMQQKSVDAQDQLVKEAEDRLGSLKGELEAAKAEILTLKSQLAESEQNLKEQSSVIEDLKSRLLDLETHPVQEEEEVGWKEDFTGFGSEEVEIPPEAAAATEFRETAELATVRSQLEEARSEMEILRSKLETAQQENESHVEQLAALQLEAQSRQTGQGTGAEAHISRACAYPWQGWTDSDFDGFGSDEKVDKSLHDEVIAELDKTRSELERLTLRLEAAEQEKEIQISRASTLQTKAAAAEDDGWNEDFDPFEAEEKVEKSLLDTVKIELEQARADIEVLKTNYDNSLEMIRELEVAAASAAQKMEMQSSKRSSDGWDDDFDAFGGEEKTNVDSLQVELEGVRVEAESLRLKLAEVEKEKEKSGHVISSLRDQIATLESGKEDGWNEDFDAFGESKVDVDGMKLELDQARSDIEALRKEKDAVAVTNSVLENKISELEIQLQESAAGSGNAGDGWNDDFEGFGEASADPAELQQKVEEGVQLLAETREKLTELEARLKEKEELLAATLEELDEERDKVVEHETAFVALNEQLEKLATLKDESSENVKTLTDEITGLKAVISKKEKDIGDEKEAWSRKEGQLSDKIKSLEVGYNQLVSKQGLDVQSVIGERDKMKAKSDLLTDKCKKLLAKCKQLEAKAKENESEMSTATLTIDELTSQLASLKNELSAKADTVNALENDITRLRDQQISLEDRQAEIDASNHSLSQIRDQLEHVQRQLEEGSAANVQLTNAVIERETAFQSLSAQLDNLVEENTRKDEVIEALNLDKDELGKENEQLESVALDLKQKLEVQSMQKAELETTLKHNAGEIESLKASCHEKETAIDEMRAVVAERESRIEKLESISNEKDLLIESIQSSSSERDGNENATLRQELEQANVENERLNGRLSELEASKTEAIESMDNKLRDQAEELDGLATSLRQSRTENEELSRKLSDLETEKNETEEALDQLKSRVVQIEESLRSDREGFEAELAKKQTLIDDLQANSGLQDQVSVHRHQLDVKEREISQLKEQVIEQLEDELAEIRQDLQSARNRIEQLEGDLAERNSQLEQARAEERPHDLAEFSQPPPDVTQYQGVQLHPDVAQYQGGQLHPDVAHYPSASFQPDLMPHYNFQGGQEPEQMQVFQMFPADQPQVGDGWNDAGWADDWFAGVHPGNMVPEQQQLPELFQQNQPQPHFVNEPPLQAAEQQYQQPEQVAPSAADPSVDIEELNSLRIQLQVNEGELVTLRDSLAGKTAECSTFENDLQELRSDFDHLKLQLEAKEEESSSLRSNLAQLKADQDLANSTYSQAMDSLRSQLHQEIDSLRSEARRTAEDKEALEAELQISEQECNGLKESLAQVYNYQSDILVYTR